VRWVDFRANGKKKRSIQASFGTQEGCSFGAAYYSAEDLTRGKHSHEIRKWKRQQPIVRLDWAHHGLGTGAIGPNTLPQYALKSDAFTYEVVLQ
jgi:beta-galactosidase